VFIRRKHYDEVATRAAAAEANAAIAAHYRVGLTEASAEVRRLTNVIIRMKDQGMVVGPESIDKVWGSYVMDEVAAEQEKAASDRGDVEEALGLTDNEISMAEAEFAAEAGRIWDEE
jgi:hypothetical protein